MRTLIDSDAYPVIECGIKQIKQIKGIKQIKRIKEIKGIKGWVQWFQIGLDDSNR